ncbi:MAG: hypothetical protein GYA87_08680 [Christensenellaceae bacterium]|nr:hypothetical protein [Christensenellaceae bacterium]
MERLPYTNNANLAYKPKTTGVYKIVVFVKDDIGKIVYGTSNDCIVNAASKLKFDDVIITEEAAPNDLIAVTTYVQYGVAPYQYAYYIYHNNNIIKRTSYSEYNQTYKFIATKVGDYKVTAFVKDATGAIVYRGSNSCVVSNNPPITYQDMIINPYHKIISSIVYMEFAISGGMGPYEYAYYVYKDGIRIKTTPYYNNVNNKSVYIKYNMLESGTYKVLLFVKDKFGKIKTQAIDNIVFDLSVKPDITSINIVPTTIYLGEEFDLTTFVDNGYRANIAYNVYRNGALYYKSNFMPIDDWYGFGMVWSFKPSHLGDYIFEAVVISSTGQIVKEQSANCTVIELEP